MDAENNLKSKLDMLLIKYSAQPAGKGYIDIIVRRELYKQFAEEILNLGINITDISWWEYVDSTDKKSKYGIGGPESKYFKGWFSELCIETDEINLSDNSDDQLIEIINVIENKEINIVGTPKISFTAATSLIPAFWLNVPDKWENALL